MQDADIHAFTPAPAPARSVPAAARRKRWPWVLLSFGLLLLAVVLATSITFVWLLGEARDGWNVVVDGESWRVLEAGDWRSGLGWVAACLAAVLVVVVLVPLVLITALGSVALVVALALLAVGVVLAVGLFAVVLVVMLALSPLWGLALLLWWLLRKPRAAAAV